MTQQSAPPVPPPPADTLPTQTEGKKAAWRNWWFWVILLLVFLLVVAMVALSSGDDSVQADVEPSLTASPTPTSSRWVITPEEVAAGMPDRIMDAMCPTIDILPREVVLRQFTKGYRMGGNVPGSPPARLVFDAVVTLCEER